MHECEPRPFLTRDSEIEAMPSVGDLPDRPTRSDFLIAWLLIGGFCCLVWFGVFVVLRWVGGVVWR